MTETLDEETKNRLFKRYVRMRMQEASISVKKLVRLTAENADLDTLSKATIERIKSSKHRGGFNRDTVRSALIALDGSLEAFEEFSSQVLEEGLQQDDKELSVALVGTSPKQPADATKATVHDGLSLSLETALPLTWEHLESPKSSDEIDELFSVSETQKYLSEFGLSISAEEPKTKAKAIA